MRFNIENANWGFFIWMGSFVVLAFVALFAMYSYYGVEKEMASQFNREQALLAKQTAMGIQQYMGDIANVLDLTSNIPSVASGDPQAIKVALKNAYNSLKSQVIIVFWENSNGILMDHYPREVLPGLDGKDFSFRTYFKVCKDMKVPFVSNIVLVGGEQYKSIPGRFESFIVAYPLVGPDGKFNGVLGCAIDLANITAHYVATIRPSKTGYAWLIDETGLMLYHPNPKWIGLNLKDIVLEMEKKCIDISGVEDIWRAMEIKDEGMYEYTFTHYPTEVITKKLLAFASVHFLNRRWITVVCSPYSDVVYLMSGTFRNTLILGSVSIFLVIGATIFLLRMNKARVKAYERSIWADKVFVAHKRMEAIFNGVPHYLVMIDSHFLISDINQRFCNVCMKPPAYFIGKHCYKDFPSKERICHYNLIQECFKTGKILEDRNWKLEVMETPFFLDVSVIPLFGSKGDVESVVQYAVDITEKKALTEKLIQAEKFAAIGQMSAHVAHELRNPLTSILLNAELLEDEVDSEEMDMKEVLSSVRSIKDEIERLSTITEEYLAYTRLPRPKKQILDPVEEVKSVIEMMKQELNKRDISFSFNAEPNMPKVFMDRGQFRQVLINLIKNAVDAMPSSGHLNISLMDRENNLLLIVKDTGFGIPEDIRRRVFDPYFTTKENGTGLGLAIVQYIASAHNGWVDVESQPGSGTTFIFSVPFHVDGEKEAQG